MEPAPRDLDGERISRVQAEEIDASFAATVTYVRTFSSGNAESQGTAGSARGRTLLIRNGTTPSHASPS